MFNPFGSWSRGGGGGGGAGGAAKIQQLAIGLEISETVATVQKLWLYMPILLS